MYIGIKDAVAIYAKVCRARYGGLATRIVADQVRALQQKGDGGGAEVWQQVAKEIETAAALGDQAAAGAARLPLKDR